MYFSKKVIKMAGRPIAFDQELAIEKATELFWIKGYKATSLEDLIGVMKIQKGSFYNTFGSKRKLFVEIVKRYDAKSLTQFQKSLNASDNPVELIKSVFIKLAGETTNKTTKGCFAGNIIVELDCTDGELTIQAKSHLIKLEKIFVQHIKEAQRNNVIKNNISAEFIGNYLLNLWNGLNITRRIYPASEALQKQVEFQLQLLN